MEHRERLAAALADRYRIEREIGSGGMATVYLAEDLKHDRHVALKVLSADLAAVLGPERFLREIHVAARLTHPHILPLLDSGEADGTLFYVMPYVEGATLRERLKREKQLSVEDALRIARQVADALDYAHRHGVVHRDIKPENILLEENHAVMADFGIARAIGVAGGERLTATGVAVGTAEYMSPEQASGERDLDGRSDVYALGCVLYEMLAGRPPFTGATIASLVAQHLTAAPPDITTIRPAVPSEVVAALTRSLAKTPADRSTPVAFAEAITSWVPASAGGVGNSAARHPPHRRRWMWAAVGVTVTAAVALFTVGRESILRYLRGGAPTPPAEAEWVLLTDFEAPPGDPTLGYAVQDLVVASLEGTGRFTGVPQAQVAEARALAKLADTTRLDVERARHLASRSKVGVVIDGRIASFPGGRFAITLRAVGVEDGGVLGSVTVESSETEIIGDVSRIAAELGARLSPAEGRFAGPDPGRIGPTSSFAAYRLAVEAQRYGYAGEYGLMAGKARQAVALDPDFVTAWGILVNAWVNSGFSTDSVNWARAQARHRQERLTPGQRLGMLAPPRSPGEAIRRIERYLEGNPTDANQYVALALDLQDVGRYDEAIDAYQRAMALAPLVPPQSIRINLVGSLARMGRIAEAKAVAAPLTGSPARRGSAVIVLASEDWAAVERQAAEMEADVSQPRRQRIWLGPLALIGAEAARGRLSSAERVLERAWAMSEGQANEVTWSVNMARVLLSVCADRALAAAPFPISYGDDPDALVHAGVSAAIAGDTAAARAYRSKVQGDSLEGGWNAPRTAPLLDALEAYRNEDWSGVVQASATLAREGGAGRDGKGLVLLARWLTATAYEELAQPDSAAAYFELIRPFRMGWGDLPVLGIPYSFAHFRLGRLYTALRQNEKAREHFTKFLDTFVDPDPEYAWMVQAARADLARLKK